MKGISIVIPALDEEEGIGDVIDQIRSVMKENEVEYEIIVINDGSTDRTGEIANQKGVRVIRNPYSAGYGASLQEGIEISKYDLIGTIDADGTYPVKSLPDLLKYIDDYDMVIGARTGRHYRRSFWKQPSRKVFQFLCEFVTGSRIPDVNSGFRIFKKKAVMQFKNNLCRGFSFSTTITLEMLLNGNFIKFVPIEFYKRKGKSKIYLVRDTLRTTQILTQTILQYNPLKLFLLISIFLFICFLISFTIYMMLRYQIIGLFCVLSFFTSILVFSLGLLSISVKK